MNEAPTELTQEAKRIKIAEARGWTGIRGITGYPSGAAKLADNYYLIPDYFNDLNACREMKMAQSLRRCRSGRTGQCARDGISIADMEPKPMTAVALLKIAKGQP